jgi:hypothetical protein
MEAVFFYAVTIVGLRFFMHNNLPQIGARPEWNGSLGAAGIGGPAP